MTTAIIRLHTALTNAQCKKLDAQRAKLVDHPAFAGRLSKKNMETRRTVLQMAIGGSPVNDEQLKALCESLKQESRNAEREPVTAFERAVKALIGAINDSETSPIKTITAVSEEAMKRISDAAAEAAEAGE